MRIRLAASIPLFVIGLVVVAAPPAGAQATASVCTDGTTSAVKGRGACSGHGGVDAKATKALSTPTQVVCADGAMSKGGKGACSGHGGIKGAATAAAPATPATPAPVSKAAKTAKPTQPAAVAPVPAATAAPAAPAQPKAAIVARASTKRGDDNDPTDAIAQCKDGLYSHAANHRGACSRHGGVTKFLKP